MKPTTQRAPRHKRVNVNDLEGIILPEHLFGKGSEGRSVSYLPLIDFEMSDYIYFIDNVSSLADLITGLSLLSPFADDALDLAESMTGMDFATFKLALPQERMAAQEATQESSMPVMFNELLLPGLFLENIMLADKARCSLTVTIVRYLEVSREIRKGTKHSK